MDPLPAPSTSRTPLPRLIDRIGPAATSNISGISTPNTSRSATPETTTEPNLTRSDGLRIKGSASRHSRPNPSGTVHLAPAAADSTPSNLNSPPPDLVSDPAAARKRKSSPPTDSDSDDQGPLLSEYACPICFSPPKSAIITPCGHILCGSCLHGSVVAQSAPQPLCPVCRTPIPNLQFSLPPSVPAPNTTPTPAPQPPRRVPPASRIIPGGFRLPTLGEDMVEVGGRHEGDVIDVDSDEPDHPDREREERWDPSRSGVVGLEILTMGRL